jgi:hypothetical protein
MNLKMLFLPQENIQFIQFKYKERPLIVSIKGYIIFIV